MSRVLLWSSDIVLPTAAGCDQHACLLMENHVLFHCRPYCPATRNQMAPHMRKALGVSAAVLLLAKSVSWELMHQRHLGVFKIQLKYCYRLTRFDRGYTLVVYWSLSAHCNVCVTWTLGSLFWPCSCNKQTSPIRGTKLMAPCLPQYWTKISRSTQWWCIAPPHARIRQPSSPINWSVIISI